MSGVRSVVVVALALAGTGCNILGPTCLIRQDKGPVSSVSGLVPAGGMTVHLMKYGEKGSQNDVEIDWPGRGGAGGPEIAVYATRGTCEGFRRPPFVNTGPCEILSQAGVINGQLVTSLTVTHGRGNPERLGTPPEYKLWVFGDATRVVTYTLRATYFFGPDC